MKRCHFFTIPAMLTIALGVTLSSQGSELDRLLDQHPAVQPRAPQSAFAPPQSAFAPTTAQATAPTTAPATPDVRARNIFYEPPAPIGAPPMAQPMAPPIQQVAPPVQQVAPPAGYGYGATPPSPATAFAPQPPATAQPPLMAPGGHIGLKYKIILQGPGGEFREVPETFPFRSGMRFRMLFEPNISGYLYIFHRGSNTKGSRLFPDPRIAGGQNRVEAHQEVMIPHSGWFLFDSNTGWEDLIIFLTPRQLDTFDSLTYGPGGALPDDGWQVVTAAVSDHQAAPSPYGVRGESGGGATDRNLFDPGAEAAPAAGATTDSLRNIVYEGPEGYPSQPLVYTPPVVEPDNWSLNVPSSSYAVESAPMLIHFLRLQHLP